MALILLSPFSCLLPLFCSSLYASEAKPDEFLTRYCAQCHGVDEQKGDRRFDKLPIAIGADVAMAERWQEILHQLQLVEMPPSDEKQPTDDDRFVRLFSEQWLGLNKLGTMPPARETFPSYHIDRLEPAMREETWRFIAELFRTNKPVTALVDSDFTYLNAGLARLYELPEIRGDRLQRVNLPADSPRRGLLGQASILTITANGVESSPVTRRVWVLEKLFGTPPSPPPPDVPPIEPDIRGATNLSHRLLTYALGRPLGFADQPALRRLQNDWKENGYNLLELLHLIGTCELMHLP